MTTEPLYVGAGSLVTHDIAEESVVGGSPAKVIGKFEDLFEKRKNDSSTSDKTIQEIWRLFEEMRQVEE